MKLIDLMVRVYLDKGLWDQGFELKLRQHYLREEEGQERREIERREGGAASSSTDYQVPRSMIRDKKRVRTWRTVFHRIAALEDHQPQFWDKVQAAVKNITVKGKGWNREQAPGAQPRGGYKGQNQGGTRGRIRTLSKHR